MKFCTVLFILSKLLINVLFNIGIVEGIIGGTEVDLDHYQYVASLQANNEHICGSGIIGKLHVVTTAHCVINENDEFIKRKYTILAGVTRLKYNIPPGIVRDVEKIYVPREYKRVNPEPTNLHYRETGDIAVIRLRNALPENSEVSILHLPLRKNGKFLTYYHDKPIVSGYGINYINNVANAGNRRKLDDPINYSFSDIRMKYAETTIIHKNECKGMYHSINEKHICAQVVQQDKEFVEGVCQGDNGGPLVLNGNIIVGVLSTFRSDCNEKKSPAIYTRITSFVNFIESTIMNRRMIDTRVAGYIYINLNARNKSSASSETLVELPDNRI